MSTSLTCSTPREEPKGSLERQTDPRASKGGVSARRFGELLLEQEPTKAGQEGSLERSGAEPGDKAWLQIRACTSARVWRAPGAFRWADREVLGAGGGC